MRGHGMERRELTSGSTWHSAGNTTYFGPYPAMTQLFAGSFRTYLQAEEESGQSVSFHQTGGLRLAATERELRLFHEYKPQYAELGIPFHVRTPEEVAELHPLIDTTNIFGAAHTPTDGHVDPVGQLCYVQIVEALLASYSRCDYQNKKDRSASKVDDDDILYDAALRNLQTLSDAKANACVSNYPEHKQRHAKTHNLPVLGQQTQVLPKRMTE